ncbi:unnamed protein product, partial [Rotaria socialis]
MSTQAIKKFKTEKGKDMLSYEGYIYTLERKTDVKLIFRCQRRDCKDAAGQLPQGDTLLRTIRRQRPAPSTNNDNQLPDNLKQTDRGENFVLHEDEKLIIFTTATNLSVL